MTILEIASYGTAEAVPCQDADIYPHGEVAYSIGVRDRYSNLF